MALVDEVLSEINEVMKLVDESQIDDVEKLVQKDKRIFVLGSGRSGLMAKGFAMRLMHIGYTVFVIGETITPSVQAGDVLISVSGSGKTSSIVELSEKAKKNGVEVIGVTSSNNSPLAQIADQVLIVPGATKTGDGVKSIQLLSTLFDQSVHITLDILALKLSRRDNVSNESAANTHSNME
ncbi:6-phospho-3-hexuloisomerase [Lentilactobacillus sp. SPB1-3]|uniref:6-phospho-3-hexuloisomerase n=1 Tax=Lentilactobacillus terminaliae TaxID=3003483 RepID=A0ACD5DFP2_9LACO|nr:6-phospho-3-hexuloisomerase [Lentilactobacillus sp. SPB1-3]MCZ0976486.1 6-phospho-3-hexuloisomerase [Lentilactobacillus sp. SPB1-3]